MNALIVAIDKKLALSAREVQNLMQEHYIWLERTWTHTKETYLSLAQLYHTPEFRKFYDDRHPKLLQFMLEAMKISGKNELS